VNPFQVLGLPVRPDLTDTQVRAAWRAVAASTHPDRPGGGDPAAYTAAATAYDQLRTPWGRSEACADLAITEPFELPPGATAPRRPGAGLARGLLLMPARIRHGRPLRLLARAVIAALLALLVLNLIPGAPSGPAVVTGLVIWFVFTARRDLSPPQSR
jgi:hypothetical protein